MQVQPRARDKLLEAGRLHIDWQSCPIKDHVSPTRCYRCQRFGHVAKYCKGPATCSYCGAQHQGTPCPKLGGSPTCANCRGPHPAYDSRCPDWVLERRKLETATRKISLPPLNAAAPPPMDQAEIEASHGASSHTVVETASAPTGAARPAERPVDIPGPPAPNTHPTKGAHKKKRHKKAEAGPEAPPPPRQIPCHQGQAPSGNRTSTYDYDRDNNLTRFSEPSDPAQRGRGPQGSRHTSPRRSEYHLIRSPEPPDPTRRGGPEGSRYTSPHRSEHQPTKTTFASMYRRT